MHAKSRTTIPRALERELYQEVGSQCPVCDITDLASLSVHHIIPYMQLPQHHFRAMIVLCNNCHGKADRNEITMDQLFAIKREVAAKKPCRNKEAQSVHKVSGVIAAGGNLNISGGVVINQGNRRNKEVARPNTVAENKWMIGYLDHLVKRFNEFKIVELKYRAEEMNHSLIRVNYQTHIGFPVRHTPVELFDKATEYLQKRIGATLVGKRNTKNGTPNYSGFFEWKAKMLDFKGITNEDLADLILGVARTIKTQHNDANAFNEVVFCEKLNESKERIAKAIDLLVARGRAVYSGIPGTWKIII